VSVPVTETTFEAEVIERSQQLPVVVDFWAEWCGPCKTLSPALEAAEASRQGQVVLAKVDVDSNQLLAGRFGVQGIPAVKAFRDGSVAAEFVGALSPAKVEAFFDSLVPSRTEELLAAGDELSLREAADLEPRRADIAVALAKARLGRGAEDEALETVEAHAGDFVADGIAARIRLTRAGIGGEAWAAVDRGEREKALDALLEEVTRAVAAANSVNAAESADSPAAFDPDELRDQLRRAVVGILSESDPADPFARTYRRRLSAALS
jgi:putative thioredoxin